MKRIIINGANGYIASNFVNELLNRGYEVIALVRGNNEPHARQRMLDALYSVSNGQLTNIANLTIYNYSLLDEDFLISENKLLGAFNKRIDYFHFAASLKYSKKTKDEIFRTNTNGVENSIKTYLKYATEKSRFFFISTAYSCGKIAGNFEEKFYENQDISHFRNYYEQSKRFAENIVKKHIENNGLNGYVLRPSQVVGNSTTGITNTDFGIFDFTKRVCTLAFRYPDNTVRVKANPHAGQNLIPVDVLVQYLIQTVKTYSLPTIMNLVAKKEPIHNDDIIEHINNSVPINIIPLTQLDKNSMSPIERLVDVGMSFTGEYSNTYIKFDTTNLNKIAANIGNDITKRSIKKMLTYFIDNVLNKKAMHKEEHAIQTNE